jgi:hypothetical protein
VSRAAPRGPHRRPHEVASGDDVRRRVFWFEMVSPGFLDCAIAGQDEEVELRIARCLSRS